jgi:hypothetical protein
MQLQPQMENLIMNQGQTGTLINGIDEMNLAPPPGMSMEAFAKNIIYDGLNYDGSLPYSLPIPTTDVMLSGTYNSNSLAEGLLEEASGGYSYANAIVQYLWRYGWYPAGITNPVPATHF